MALSSDGRNRNEHDSGASGHYLRPPYREPRSIKCAYCDKELSGDDETIDYDGDYVCAECFMDQLQEDLLIGEIAKKLGFIVKPATEAAEEMEDDSE